MKHLVKLFTGIPFFLSALTAQFNPQFEVSTAFPFHGFQNAPREYFLTTKYSAGVSFSMNDYTDLVSTLTYTQQNAIITEVPSYRIGALTDSRTIYIPFTSDPSFAEYGAFTGVRLKTSHNVAQVFLKGQMGLLAAKYGTIQKIRYENLNDLPGGFSYKEVEGDVMKFQIAAMYGGGIILNPSNSISLVLDIHAINRFTKQSLDVYQSVGIQFGL